jgi:hypothetical protein
MSLAFSETTKICEHCSKEYVRKSTVDRKQFAASRFCSNSCRGSYLGQGERNANWKGGKAKCTDCSKELGGNYTSRGTKFCHSCAVKGERHPNWKGGVTNPQCVNCSAVTGDMNSVLCRNCYKGALHPFWKGGTSTLQSLVRAMPENRQWIRQCMYRDRYTCQECDIESNGTNMQVHHKKQFAQILRDNEIDSVEKARSCEELWDMDNGITLCKSCHKLTESFNRKLS